MLPRIARLVCLEALLFAGLGVAQQKESPEELAARGHKEYTDKNYDAAERDFRELAKIQPSNILVQIFLGQTLFEQKKFAEAIGPYEKAQSLEKAGTKLNTNQHRILTDQLAMSYGIGGLPEKARTLLDDAARQDPEYPMNYYNLACLFAESGDREKMLSNLGLAVRYRKNTIMSEAFPDPRSDSSFEKYIHDEGFLKVTRELSEK